MIENQLRGRPSAIRPLPRAGFVSFAAPVASVDHVGRSSAHLLCRKCRTW